MALVFTGTRTKSGGIHCAIRKQLNISTLKPVKRVTFKFDPFGNNPREVREFMLFMTTKQSIKTNPLCRFKYDVASDRSEPLVNFELENGSNVLFKCNNLTVLDMYKLYNKHITILAPKEEVIIDQSVTTKVAAKKGIKR